MNINERLTARTENGMAYLKNVKSDEQQVEGSYNTLKCIKESWEKLAYLEDLHEKKRLIELPCKVGDNVWYLDFEDMKMHALRIQGMSINYNGLLILHLGNWVAVSVKEIGESVFFAKADAKKALKESEVK